MRTLLSLSALVCSVIGQTKDLIPPEFPPEKGPPHDYHNCRINANTIFPWILAVFDKASDAIVGHGSLLTYISFISTCRQYSKRPTAYLARGQFVWNLTRPLDPCSQDRNIVLIIKHPKCLESPQLATFFDYAIFKIKDPFAITGPNFPTLPLTNLPLEMMEGVKYINIIPNTVGCVLPSFLDQKGKIPVFDWNSFVESIPFHTKCVKLLCEKDPPDATFTTMCEKRFGQRAKGTQLCMRYKNTTRTFKMGPDNTYWLAGAPLTCNSSMYGIAAQAKIRKDFSFHYIVTLLRVWEWLIEELKKYSAPWVQNVRVTIDDSSIKIQNFPEPNRPPIEFESGQVKLYIHGDAAVFTPLMKNMIPTLLLCCFYCCCVSDSITVTTQ